ncbi:hypothetical protein [Bifidobacterium sp.]|uniref:hypothetical protein n=1 Tax=Bifidobacterium sp. TaxID=41200 RepID=UPI0025B917AE|nr:hypothetical protein [Bifidobacterium sp.]MCH4208934.1 hypothetical protein [Bifidobacterium sp.]
MPVTIKIIGAIFGAITPATDPPVVAMFVIAAATRASPAPIIPDDAQRSDLARVLQHRVKHVPVSLKPSGRRKIGQQFTPGHDEFGTRRSIVCPDKCLQLDALGILPVQRTESAKQYIDASISSRMVTPSGS